MFAVSVCFTFCLFFNLCISAFPVMSGHSVWFYCHGKQNGPFSRFYLNPLGCLFFFTLKPTRNHQSPSSASLPTQQASSLGSRSPGLSQGVRLKARQPLPDHGCYYRVSFVSVVSISTLRKNRQLDKAEVTGESSCIKCQILLPASILFTRQWLPWPNRSSKRIMLKCKFRHFACYEFDGTC